MNALHMRIHYRWMYYVLLISVFCTTLPVSAQTPHHMGVATCSSSNCHGGTAPRNSSNVFQNEYITWQKHDRHAMAYAVLEGEDSKRIGYHLGIDAPNKEPLCLQCHATYVPQADKHGEKYQLADGVGCESCHGAAEGWLKEHTETGATHERNISLGMADIIDPQKRTRLCAGCHFGTDDHAVDHRLIGAGHPRLTFELDTFGMIQPKHWQEDEDYQKRKGAYSSARSWLIGQVSMASESLDKLLSQKRANLGRMPELTLMYCYSCHHSLTELQWKKREYDGAPGQLRLNIAHLLMVREALRVIGPGELQEFEASLLGLLRNTGTTRMYHDYASKDVSSIARELKNTLDSRIVGLAQHASYDEKTLRALLRTLLTYGTDAGAVQYEVAEQIAMGVSSIVAAMDPSGALYKVQIDSMYKSLRTPEAFVAEEFTAAAHSFLGSAS